jgi:hypothetical protein
MQIGIVYVYYELYVYVQGCPIENQTHDTPQPDQPQRDRPTACVIARQYSSSTFASSRFHSHKEKFGAPFKNFIFFSFLYLLKIA